jgi:uncharacterized protein
MSKKTVAVVGASTERSKFSNKAVRAYDRDGWEVFPINPKGGEIEGHKAYPSIRDMPVKIDRVTLYLPPELGLKVLDDIAAVKPDEFYVNPGAESEVLIERARSLGLDPIQACSIVEIGAAPSEFPG